MFQRDRVDEAISYGEEHIDLTGRAITHTILGFPYRNYFIYRVKAPFMKFIIWISKKYPDSTPINNPNTLAMALLPILDKLIEYEHNSMRIDFFIACRRIILAEVGHDGYYGDRILAEVDFLLDAILEGNFPYRTDNCPDSKWWNEPKPYGGKHSTTYKMFLHRVEIKRIMQRLEVTKDA